MKPLLPRMLLRMILIAALAWTAWPPQLGQAAAAVTWPTLALQLVSGGLPGLVTIASASDQSGRLYLVQQSGTIRILQSGALQPGSFLDIHSLVSCCGERGLLGLAFPPGYAAKGHFYVYYTDLNGDIVLARYNAFADRTQADPASGVLLLTIPHPVNNNHNGGQLAFGPDGYLYSGHGDGGSGGDPPNNAQNPDILLGKILRLDVEGTGCVQNPPKPQNYCIPPGNPFVGISGKRAEIWAFGLRNPWRFSFDRQTGDLYIGDVGQNVEEEIDFQASGSAGGTNYGWKIREGDLCYSPATGCISPAGYVGPVATYDHGASDSNGCSVNGGYVYRGPNIFLNMQGVYFYADYCLGKIYGLKNEGGWQTTLLKTAPFLISTFGEDEQGYIYLGDYTHGAVYLLQGALDPAALPQRSYLGMVQR